MGIGSPADNGVIDDGVLNIDYDAGGGVNRRKFFDGEDALEEVAALAAVLFGNFDAHEAQFEELLDQGLAEDAGLVHFADEWRDALTGKAANGIAKQFFFVIESGEGHRFRQGQRSGAGTGGGTTGVSENFGPSPRPIRVWELSLPVGDSLFSVWNWRRASLDSVPQVPFGSCLR